MPPCDAPILVRDNRPEDYAALCGLLGGVFEEFRGRVDSRVFLAYLGDVVDGAQPARILVAESGGQVVGTVTYRPAVSPHPGWASLRAFAVDSGWRRLGVGRLLLHQCIALAWADGIRVLCLHAPEAMDAALSFCWSLGFRSTPALDYRVKGDCPEAPACGLVARAFCLPLVRGELVDRP